MFQITIRLPSNRDFAGTLKLEDAKGKLIAGPFQVCARAHDELARISGNPDRVAVLPFGDMPLGEYQITQIIKSGPGTPYDADEFGAAGIVFLQPKHGEAALADANGRFIFLIQGGALGRNGALRPTDDGSLRLSNRDQRKLVGALRRLGAEACRCFVTNSGIAKHRVAASDPARVASLPTRGNTAHSGSLAAGATAAGLAETSRRSWLRTMLMAAGAFASAPGLLLFSPPKARGQSGGTDYSSGHAGDEVKSAAGYGQKAVGESTQPEPNPTETKPGQFGIPVANPSPGDLNGPLENAHNDLGKIFDNAASQIAPPPVDVPTPPSAPVETPNNPPAPVQNYVPQPQPQQPQAPTPPAPSTPALSPAEQAIQNYKASGSQYVVPSRYSQTLPPPPPPSTTTPPPPPPPPPTPPAPPPTQLDKNPGL
jgi:hypothetical protein